MSDHTPTIDSSDQTRQPEGNPTDDANLVLASATTDVSPTDETVRPSRSGKV